MSEFPKQWKPLCKRYRSQCIKCITRAYATLRAPYSCNRMCVALQRIRFSFTLHKNCIPTRISNVNQLRANSRFVLWFIRYTPFHKRTSSPFFGHLLCFCAHKICNNNNWHQCCNKPFWFGRIKEHALVDACSSTLRSKNP